LALWNPVAPDGRSGRTLARKGSRGGGATRQRRHPSGTGGLLASNSSNYGPKLWVRMRDWSGDSVQPPDLRVSQGQARACENRASAPNSLMISAMNPSSPRMRRAVSFLYKRARSLGRAGGGGPSVPNAHARVLAPEFRLGSGRGAPISAGPAGCGRRPLHGNGAVKPEGLKDFKSFFRPGTGGLPSAACCCCIVASQV
jgi:hypothetical protein